MVISSKGTNQNVRKSKPMSLASAVNSSPYWLSVRTISMWLSLIIAKRFTLADRASLVVGDLHHTGGIIGISFVPAATISAGFHVDPASRNNPLSPEIRYSLLRHFASWLPVIQNGLAVHTSLFIWSPAAPFSLLGSSGCSAATYSGSMTCFWL